MLRTATTSGLLAFALLLLPSLVWAQQIRIVPDDGAWFDNFGERVALSGDGQRALVSAPFDDVVAGDIDQGSVYVFNRELDGSWTQEALLVPDDIVATDTTFGRSLTLSGDGSRALIGMPLDAASGLAESGSAYVFVRNVDGTWTQEAKLTASDAAAFDQFGKSVDISEDGRRAVVGAWWQDVDGNQDEGSIYIFERELDDSWSQVVQLTADEAANSLFPNFGRSVAMNALGTRVVAGAHLDDLTNNDDQGRAYVFDRAVSGTWSQTAMLAAEDAAPIDNFGYAVDISGDGGLVVVGSWLDDVATGDQGSVYAFVRDVDGTWLQEARLTGSASASSINSNFGSALALDALGDRVIVGAPLDDVTGVDTNDGRAYVFDRVAEGTWVEKAVLTADPASGADLFASSVAISDNGQYALVGSVFDDDTDIGGNNDVGAVYFFGPASLPVELTAFDALSDGSSVTLRWHTASEANNAGFEVQRRTEAGFEPLAFVEGHGTTAEAQSYSFLVDELAVGRHVFRLKQVDFDGTTSFSPEVEVAVGLEETHRLSAVVPHPVVGEGALHVSVAKTQHVSVALYNALGQRLRILHVGMLQAESMQQLTLDTQGLASGVYFIRMAGEGFVDQQRVVLAR